MFLQSCSSSDGNKDVRTAPVNNPASISDFPVKIGAPYDVNGTKYVPQDVANYDEVGYASYYGEELAGRPTANGEIFNPNYISAAHKTLPLPSYVEVTSLETGRTILVRINDRGPFANDRLIDLSQGAARQLGITSAGVAGVRVRKVNPPEQEKAVLRQGAQITQRLDTPESLLRILRDNLNKLPKPVPVKRASVAPAPAAAPAGANGTARNNVAGAPYARPSAQNNKPASQNRQGRFVVENGKGQPSQPAPASAATQASSGYVVQIGSFSSRSRAEALARKTGAKTMVDSSGKLYRVRFGPYSSEAEAQGKLESIRQQGYSGAKLYRE
ncbi:hypothetical protein LPB140_07735 [Sphingorhabdus lutea]|uniref:Endolytic peptidoglycan transglycosylase RlpA n=1 Tax=Sphingorhabdus lutea TaxID=1913578 RepID=A0A1L3JEZ0_9SPHN|nr:hypothetical protein LPB140_07735 [Sphingorhabdus lutea]